MRKENAGTLDHTTPVFIQHQYLLGGRDEKTASATGTFIKFSGRHYVVTCRHVVEAVEPQKGQTLAIVLPRVIYNLCTPTLSGPLPSARIPGAGFNGEDVDIAISPIDHAWDYLRENGRKKAVDLDAWSEPIWSDVEDAKACGWLNNYKESVGDQISTKGVEIYAGMASPISPNRPEFTMYSPRAENAETLLSGISGGLIVALENDIERPLGLIFEGFPSEAESLNERSPESYLQPGDLLVRGHVLTPSIFADWLRRL